MSSRAARVWTTLLAFGAGFLVACAMSTRQPAAGAAPVAASGLTWKRDGDRILFTPGAAGTVYMTVAADAAAPNAQPPGPSPAAFSFTPGQVAVPAASTRVAAYALTPLFTCRSGQCTPCVRGSGSNEPDCGYPPNPWVPGSLLSVFWR